MSKLIKRYSKLQLIKFKRVRRVKVKITELPTKLAFRVKFWFLIGLPPPMTRLARIVIQTMLLLRILSGCGSSHWQLQVCLHDLSRLCIDTSNNNLNTPPSVQQKKFISLNRPKVYWTKRWFKMRSSERFQRYVFFTLLTLSYFWSSRFWSSHF